jgi:hypothetical protein
VAGDADLVAPAVAQAAIEISSDCRFLEEGDEHASLPTTGVVGLPLGCPIRAVDRRRR